MSGGQGHNPSMYFPPTFTWRESPPLVVLDPLGGGQLITLLTHSFISIYSLIIFSPPNLILKIPISYPIGSNIYTYMLVSLFL